MRKYLKANMIHYDLTHFKNDDELEEKIQDINFEEIDLIVFICED